MGYHRVPYLFIFLNWRVRELSQWLKCFLYKPDDWRSDPPNPHKARYSISTAIGGSQKNLKACRPARLASATTNKRDPDLKDQHPEAVF